VVRVGTGGDGGRVLGVRPLGVADFHVPCLDPSDGDNPVPVPLTLGLGRPPTPSLPLSGVTLLVLLTATRCIPIIVP
jgi:hypothetical protein